MPSTFKYALATLVITTCFASGAEARGNHPCRAEHQTAKSACATDKHTKDCKAAHKAVKDCRIAHGLPVKGEKNNPAGSPPAEVTSPTTNGQTPAAAR